MAITSAEMKLRQSREATIREHIDAENHHDPNRAVATFSSYRASSVKGGITLSPMSSGE